MTMAVDVSMVFNMSGISDLANLIRIRRAEGKRFVVMLGAGASITSKVPDARSMMKEVVEQHASRIDGADIGDRFDKLMRGPEENRRSILKPYLDKTPSSGYARLAHLIKQGYFDTVITFNFDLLLEKALHEAEVHDFTTIIRGEIADHLLPDAVEQPGVKVVKLHGSLKGVSNFIFTREELVEYPTPIGGTLEKLTAGDIMVCGYAYGDQCVITSFSKSGKGNVVVINPNPPRMLLDVAEKRKGQFVFSGVEGRFDEFFDKLAAALEPEKRTRPTGRNPFKFLEAYRAEDRAVFLGRDESLEEANLRFVAQSPKAAFVAGPSKAGKTSLVRAGLVPLFQLEPLYFRCQADFETWLPGELARRHGWSSAPEMAVALKALVEGAGSRVVLILDQFERVVRRFDKRPKGRTEFLALMKGFVAAIPDGMTVVFVSTSDELFLSTLITLGLAQHCMTIQPLESQAIGTVIQNLAQSAGLPLDPDSTKQLLDRYDNSDLAEPFTLAHVNAVCHLLYDSGDMSPAGLKRTLDDHGETLNRIINQYDVIGFFEDIPLDEKARALLPRMMKVISKEGQKNMAECLASHFCDLFPTFSHMTKESSHGG